MKRQLALVLAVFLCSSCARVMSGGRTNTALADDSAASPARTSDWAQSLSNSLREAELGRYGAADRILVDFSQRHRESPEAAQASYWRAVYALDPLNRAGDPAVAIVLLDGYIASGPMLTHRSEALVMRRLAASIQNLRVASAETPTRDAGAAISPDARDAAREAELQKLRQELKDTKEELDRLRRRLAPPPASQPPPGSGPPADSTAPSVPTPV